MIIRYPTGFYRTVIPLSPDDGGNVTFTISNDTPPRANLLFPKIPPGIVDKKRQPRTISVLDRRDTVGDLVFTILRSTRSEEGNSNREYEIGQVLEFSDAPLKTLDPMFVGPTTETRHDVTRLDYTLLDVTEDEQQLIADSSLLTQKVLADSLNSIRQKRSDAEQLVVVNQKIINDVNRTLDALAVIQNSSAETDNDVDELVIKLKSKLDAAFAARDQAVANANLYASQAADLVDQLRELSVVLT